jgi:hypothetical protein
MYESADVEVEWMTQEERRIEDMCQEERCLN